MVVKRYFLLIALSFLPTSLFSNKLYFPQVSFGGGNTTTIILMNAGTTNVSSPFQIYAQTGVLLRSIPTTVPGEGSTRLSITDTGVSIIRSWGVFDAGTGTVKGVAILDTRSTTGTLSSRVGVLGVEAANHFSLPVDVAENGLSNTVFAMANVNSSSDLILYLQLVSESGNGSPVVTGASAYAITLARRNQITTLVTDIWPQLKVGFRGTLIVAVVSTAPANSLVVTALSVKDGLFAPVPAISAFVNTCRGCWDY
jgi:hypothetical protein